MKESIDLASIDWTPAQSVRAKSDAETVESYKECYLAINDMPPIRAFRGGGKIFAGDGRHRGEAVAACGFDDIDADVRSFPTEEEAEWEAYKCAASANVAHGLRRSREDARVAIAAIIRRPQCADHSDQKIADICRVSHNTVYQVRQALMAAGALSGPALERAKSVNPNRQVRGGVRADGSGNTEKSTPGKNGTFISPSVVATGETISEEERTTEFAAFHRPPKPETVFDAKGRPVPSRMLAAFAGRKLFKDRAKVISNLIDEIKADAGPHMAAAFPQDCIIRLEDALRAVAGGSPFVVCPVCGDDEDAKCGCCTGRGWIAKNGFTLLTDSQKRTVKEWEDSFRNGHPNNTILDNEAA